MEEYVRTLDQERAADSLRKVKRIKNTETEKNGDDYAGYVVRLASDIYISGLGQALAQLLAASKNQENDPHYWVYRDLESWLCRDHPLAPYPGEKDLLEALMNYDRFHYQKALAEAMAWLEWHKKISVAYLKKTAEGSD